MSIIQEVGKLFLEIAIAGVSVYNALKWVLEKYIDKDINSKLQEEKYKLETLLKKEQASYQTEIDKKVHLNDIELSKVQQKLNVHENTANKLSDDQQSILSIFLKFQTPYYLDEALIELPSQMSGRKKARFETFIETEDKLNEEGKVIKLLTMNSKISLRLIHAAFEESEQLGNKMLKASNPVVAFNVMMIEAASSEKSIKILSYYLQEVYTNRLKDLDIKNGLPCLISLIYKNLILDYKGIDIADYAFLTFYINNLDIEETKGAIKILKEDIESI